MITPIETKLNISDLISTPGRTPCPSKVVSIADLPHTQLSEIFSLLTPFERNFVITTSREWTFLIIDIEMSNATREQNFLLKIYNLAFSYLGEKHFPSALLLKDEDTILKIQKTILSFRNFVIAKLITLSPNDLTELQETIKYLNKEYSTHLYGDFFDLLSAHREIHQNNNNLPMENLEFLISSLIKNKNFSPIPSLIPSTLTLSEKRDLLNFIVKETLNQQYFHTALKILHSIKFISPNQKNDALEEFSVIAARNKQFQNALSAAKAISSSLKWHALVFIIMEQAKNTLFTEAFSTLNSFPLMPMNNRFIALSEISLFLAKNNLFDQSFETILLIDDKDPIYKYSRNNFIVEYAKPHTKGMKRSALPCEVFDKLAQDIGAIMNRAQNNRKNIEQNPQASKTPKVQKVFIGNLPPESLTEVLSFLSPFDKTFVATVNKTWNSFVLDIENHEAKEKQNSLSQIYRSIHSYVKTDKEITIPLDILGEKENLFQIRKKVFSLRNSVIAYSKKLNAQNLEAICLNKSSSSSYGDIFTLMQTHAQIKNITCSDDAKELSMTLAQHQDFSFATEVAQENISNYAKITTLRDLAFKAIEQKYFTISYNIINSIEYEYPSQKNEDIAYLFRQAKENNIQLIVK